ncbi:uncharacterized protein si:dkeyp-50b9.1 isoform X1 [Anguilla anguilla]|uniref:uncharacterized protein si:dkeyp-50b9.1 isoform X1 n=2 Tax=Anguilla anguilla TaxID=7936 RepID=UPI0015A8524D|nr:uncharacterized protein si:dkeyp-50b9.1 isoform X1 [Anguilla anguilla]
MQLREKSSNANTVAQRKRFSIDPKPWVCRQCVVMEGSVTNLNTVAFKPRKTGNRSDFNARPSRVNFHELVQLSDSPAMVPEVENRDILSAVVALFDVSFPELGTDEIYDIVSSPDSQTIVLLRSHTDVLEEYRGREPTEPPGITPPPAESRDGESEKGRFCEVFSESDDSSDEAGDSAEPAQDRSEWEKFSSGVTEFLVNVGERRATRNRLNWEQEIPPSAVGAESLIVAAATYKLRRLEIGEKVLELSLLTTRRRYRKCGVGSYIVELLKSPAVCGPYDVLLAHAESNAVDFFTKCGLTDDPLLNDKFREVRDEWTNTTLMSYLSSFSIGSPYHSPVPHADSGISAPGPSLNLWEVELEVDLMRKKALLAYQQQAVCVTRLVQEVSALREQLSLQVREMKALKMELELERKRRSRTEQQFLEYRLMTSQQLVERPNTGTDEQDFRVAEDSGAESVDTTEEGPCRTEEWPEIRQATKPPVKRETWTDRQTERNTEHARTHTHTHTHTQMCTRHV